MVSLSVNLTNDPLTALRATGWNRGSRDSPIGPCPRGYQAGGVGRPHREASCRPDHMDSRRQAQAQGCRWVSSLPEV